MLMVMHSETVDGTSPVAPEKLTVVIKNIFKSGIIIIAEADGKIIGSISGVESSDWWSNELYLADVWFFVYKEYRKSRAALKLIKSFIEVGQISEAKVRLGHSNSGDIDRKDKFYDRLGMTKVGSIYMET
tara:strand:+ start:229 stop:618 length:390 start_codon:yes stop_codon:yes gene_type:complete